MPTECKVGWLWEESELGGSFFFIFIFFDGGKYCHCERPVEMYV